MLVLLNLQSWESMTCLAQKYTSSEKLYEASVQFRVQAMVPSASRLIGRENQGSRTKRYQNRTRPSGLNTIAFFQ